MNRPFNFSAGPAAIPEEVLQTAAAEMMDYRGSGQSVMEMSHRSKTFDKIIKDAEALYRQAIKNNDTPLLIKSLILKTTFTLAIDHEDYPAILSEVEKYLSQETDSAGIAVINSYCAQLYAEYYNNNSYLINQRTPVTDYIPEDIASWSSNIFAEKIKTTFQN